MKIIGKIKDKKIKIFKDNKLITTSDLYIYFDGQIFNQNEIIEEYKLKNVKTQENLIKKLYLKDRKLKFLKKLDGNFCIIICDIKNNLIYLIKDKLGNKNLYYYKNKDKIIFSNSLKLIQKQKEFEANINEQALANYFGYGYIYEPYTIFENTHKVLNGSYLKISKSKIKMKKYFSLEKLYRKSTTINTNDEEIEDMILNTLDKIIEKYGTNKKVGVFISSGKDGTLLANKSKKLYKKNINTYTVGFTDKSRDESLETNKIAKYIKSKHHTYMFDKKDVIEILKDIVDIYEEPFADPSIIPTVYLFKNIKEKNDFIITGDDNDTLFMSGSEYNYGVDSKKAKKRKMKDKENKRRGYKNINEQIQYEVIRRIRYSDKFLNKKCKVYKMKKIGISKRRGIQIANLKYLVPYDYIVKMGSVANYYNLKLYTPFFDLDIIKLIFRIQEDKIYHKEQGPKYIYTKALYKEIPESYFSNYKKNGFGIPLFEWTDEIFISLIKKITTKDFIQKQNLFNYQELIYFINNYKEYKVDEKVVPSVLFRYFIFQLWYKENIK